MADPVPAKTPARKESDDFFEHVKSFFRKGPGPDPKNSEIVQKGGPGGQLREKHLMDAVDNAMTGATDDM